MNDLRCRRLSIRAKTSSHNFNKFPHRVATKYPLPTPGRATRAYHTVVGPIAEDVWPGPSVQISHAKKNPPKTDTRHQDTNQVVQIFLPLAVALGAGIAYWRSWPRPWQVSRVTDPLGSHGLFLLTSLEMSCRIDASPRLATSAKSLMAPAASYALGVERCLHAGLALSSCFNNG